MVKEQVVKEQVVKDIEKNSRNHIVNNLSIYEDPVRVKDSY